MPPPVMGCHAELLARNADVQGLKRTEQNDGSSRGKQRIIYEDPCPTARISDRRTAQQMDCRLRTPNGRGTLTRALPTAT